MIRMGDVQDCIAQQHQVFLMLAKKNTCERLVLCLEKPTFPGPLPELCLCGPELLAICTNHQRRLLLLFLLLRAQILFTGRRGTLLPTRTLF